ncbi:hypothetical protein ACCS33_21295 [Rhizobium ruizarguesonis]
MPVRRRAGKRRSTDGLDQWFFVFSSGHDFFDELADLGIGCLPLSIDGGC